MVRHIDAELEATEIIPRTKAVPPYPPKSATFFQVTTTAKRSIHDSLTNMEQHESTAKKAKKRSWQ